MKQISIKHITTAGIFLALLTLLKYLDIVMVKINGYSAIEFYWVVGALSMVMLPWTSSLLILTISPFFWLAMGQMEVYSPYSVIFDYFLPLLSLLVIKLSRNKWMALTLTLVASLIKYLSHAISGVLFYGATFEFSLEFNAPFVFITVGVSLIIMLIVYSRLRYLSRMLGNYTVAEVAFNLKGQKATEIKLMRFGYLNKVYKVCFDEKKYVLRIPRFARADWENEAKLYKVFYGEECQVDISKGYLLKPFIEGTEVSEWNDIKLSQLDRQIKKWHNMDIKGIKTQDWNAWNKYSFKLDLDTFTRYQELVDKYKNKLDTVSHNDINRRNVIENQDGIHLIDFEWARVNHNLFDYAQFYVAEDIHIHSSLTQNNEYSELIFMTLVFSLLWSYSFKVSPKIIKLRKKYIKKLDAFNL